MNTALARIKENDPAQVNAMLADLDARERVRWTLRHLTGPFAVSSSFGAQSAVALHLVNAECPGIPVILVDTGYLFPETYQFADQLAERLRLNLHVVQSPMSPAWFEARYGRLWEAGVDGIGRYNELRKVEPMRRKLAQLGVHTWFAGLRRAQSRSRAMLLPLTTQDGRWKACPLYDWTDRMVFDYLREHDLPYHPLWHKGYVSIGDWHTTRTLADAGDAEATRFFGLKRECGLHQLPDLPEGL